MPPLYGLYPDRGTAMFIRYSNRSSPYRPRSSNHSMPDLTDRSVLVIGGAGFIGSHVVDLLLEKPVSEVIVYDDFSRGKEANLGDALDDERLRIFTDGGNVLQTDVLGEAVSEADFVLHLAALWLLHCQKYPRSAFEVNVRGTFNVLEACRDHEVEKLVFSSSASVYGDADEVPMREEHPFNNRTFYGATKISGEAMSRAFHEQYGLPYLGLRYMNVYGPRQDYEGAYVAVIMKVLDRIDQGLPPLIYGDGSQSYDFVYVRDVARANVRALESDRIDRFYNVGTGVGTSIDELCELLLELTGSDLDPEYRPQAESFVTHRVGSTERARSELGFEADTELREGLKALIRWRTADRKSDHAPIQS